MCNLRGHENPAGRKGTGSTQPILQDLPAVQIGLGRERHHCVS